MPLNLGLPASNLALGTCPGSSGYKVLTLEFLTSSPYLRFVKATLTSKGQITIPVLIRNRLHLQPGDVLEFDENTPFLKATKAIDPKAWDEFGRDAVDPWKGKDIHAALDELRGEVELPPARDR